MLYTINKPLEFCYITENQAEWIWTGEGYPHEGQQLVSKEIVVELLEALKVCAYMFGSKGVSDKMKEKIHKKLRKAITNAEK